MSATTTFGRMSEAEFRSLYERLRAQVPWGPGDRRGALNYITPAEVLAACGAVRRGRTVSLAAPVEDWVTPDNPDPTLLPVLAERQIAALGSDGNNDTAPSAVDGVDFPVHVLAVNALGLHLMDYLQFGDLAPLCEREGRWSFLCVIAPLRLPAGTGSPVNPIAIV